MDIKTTISNEELHQNARKIWEEGGRVRLENIVSNADEPHP